VLPNRPACPTMARMSQPTPPPAAPAVPYGPPSTGTSPDGLPAAGAVIDLSSASTGRNVAGTAGKWALRLLLPIILRAIFRAIFR
jgi:hypothetical protein